MGGPGRVALFVCLAALIAWAAWLGYGAYRRAAWNRAIAAQAQAQAAPRYQEKVRENRSTSNLKQIGIGLVMYCDDNGGTLPPLETPDAYRAALSPYIRNDLIFLDPATGAPYAPNPALSRVNLRAIRAPSRAIVFYEARPRGDGTRRVTFADGHGGSVPEAEWRRMLLPRRGGGGGEGGAPRR